MIVEKVVTETINLKVSKEEALWLRAVMQNTLHGESLADEDAQNRKYREEFFRALSQAL